MLSRRRFLQAAAGVGAVSVLPRAALGLEPSRHAGEWLAGDFHCHTLRSHDVGHGPGAVDPRDPRTGEEALLWGWTAGEQIRIAESRGLDFLAVTDHNTVETLTDADYRSERLVLVPGYEHSLAGGHAGVFLPRVEDFAGDIVRDGDGSRGFSGSDGLARFLDIVHEREGIAVLNHPFYGNPDAYEALAWGYPVDVSRRFDAVEAWNASWLARHDVVPFADFDNHLAVPWWEREFLPHRRVPALAGSDNHFRVTTAVAGVGQPTTWVHARERSVPAVLDAVRAGRTSVSAAPPGLGGPRLLLSATDPQGREAMIGDDVRPRVPLEVAVTAERAAGQRVRVIAGGRVVGEQVASGAASTHRFTLALPPGSWLRAELHAGTTAAMLAITSPVYAGDREGLPSADEVPYEPGPSLSRLLPLLT